MLVRTTRATSLHPFDSQGIDWRDESAIRVPAGKLLEMVRVWSGAYTLIVSSATKLEYVVRTAYITEAGIR